MTRLCSNLYKVLNLFILSILLLILNNKKYESCFKCDEFVIGSQTNYWESVVDGKPDCFAVQIAKNLVPGLAEELVPAFTQITPTEKIAI